MFSVGKVVGLVTTTETEVPSVAKEPVDSGNTCDVLGTVDTAMGSSGPVIGVVVLAGITAILLSSITRVASIMVLCNLLLNVSASSISWFVVYLLVLNHPQYILIMLLKNF